MRGGEIRKEGGIEKKGEWGVGVDKATQQRFSSRFTRLLSSDDPSVAARSWSVAGSVGLAANNKILAVYKIG